MRIQLVKWLLAMVLPLVCCSTWVEAQKTWEVASIPPALLENASAVIRTDELFFEIESKSQAKVKRKLAVTILNEKGEVHNEMVVGYDKFTKIVDLEGTLYDHAGKVIKKLKNSEINDYGYGVTSDIITDARVKVASFGKKSYAYPYTVEFTYEKREKNMMFYPTWYPVKDDYTSIENTVFKVKVPANTKFRYKLLNEVGEPNKETATDGSTQYAWSLKNRQVLQVEDFSLAPEQLLPMVVTAPSEFEVQDYQGDFSSWNDFGKFYGILNSNRDVLPEQVKVKVQELTKGLSSDQEKIQVLYKWMQSTTRYVSIQLGIGGWQTMEANAVATKGYGDCKALTNYMIALLKEAKVSAYPALIKAGDNREIAADFPSNQFNHVIACIPQAKDTTWLECTSQVNTANYLGSFTGDRYALLVLPEGGKLVKTPSYLATDNTRKRVTEVALSEDGQAKVKVTTRYTGLQHERPARVVQTYTAEEQKKWILNQLTISGVELEDFKIQNNPASKQGEVEETLAMTIKQLASKTGTRLFIKPTFMTKEVTLRTSTTARKQDFFLDPDEYNFTYADEVQLAIPATFKIESLPQSMTIESDFGIYTTQIVHENAKITYRYSLQMKGGRYKADQFVAWNDFLKKVRRAERTQIVLLQ